MVVGVEREVRGGLDVVEDAPEGFRSVEGAAVFEVVSPAAVPGGEAGVVVPQDPFVV